MPNDDARAAPAITVADELDPADIAVMTDGLRAYDLSQTGYYDFRPLAVFVRANPQGRRRAPRTVRIRARLYRLVLPARGFAPRTDRQPRIGDGRRRGQTTRLHPDRADDAQRRGARVLPEARLRHRRDDRLRSAGSDPLLHDEAAGAAARLIEF